MVHTSNERPIISNSLKPSKACATLYIATAITGMLGTVTVRPVEADAPKCMNKFIVLPDRVKVRSSFVVAAGRLIAK